MKTAKIAFLAALTLLASLVFVELSVAAVCSSRAQLNVRNECKKGEKEISEIGICKTKKGRIYARGKCKKGESLIRSVSLKIPAPRPKPSLDDLIRGGAITDDGRGSIDGGRGGGVTPTYDKCDGEHCWCDTHSECDDMDDAGVCDANDWDCDIFFTSCICKESPGIGGGGKGGYGGGIGLGGGGVIIY